MNRNSWIIICLAYIVGLLSANLVAGSSSSLTGQQLFLLIAGSSGLTILSAIALHKTSKISSRVWFATAAIAILAVIYFQLRIPQPDSNDISYRVTALNGEIVTVAGKVVSEPRLNASQKLRFRLEAKEIGEQQQVSGKLYVTIPLLQGTGINLGEKIQLRGILYLPQPANNPGGFDFKNYLARQDIFAGMQGFEVIFDRDAEPGWGWWKLRRRIVRSHLRGLGSPTGQLVSSMVLGRKAVDLPTDLRDRFIEAGLAHVLAASGFHVSLLLGLILKLTNRFPTQPRLAIGIGTLFIYLGLTGIQASVLRACLMGCAVLLALAMETKVKPLGSLLVAATIILLFNPLLIGDLGFQLSFLATFGLIVTMPGLQARLDWLPPTIATLIAVPLAASIWVLPLLCYVFNSVATYSVAVNIICTPLITVISLGGMISAIAALIVPLVGSAIASLLFYPTQLLIAIIDLFVNLPGSSWAIGQISIGVLLTFYGLLLLVWLNQWWCKRWWLVLLFVFVIITIPIVYRHFNLTQITVLPTQPEPVIVVQDRGKVILINSGDSKALKYTVLPFLAKQGINHLDYFINLEPNTASDWRQLSDRLSIEKILNYNSEQTLATNSDRAKIRTLERTIKTNSLEIAFDREFSGLKIETKAEIWLISSKSASKNRIPYTLQSQLSPKPVILISAKIPPEWLEFRPQTIITAQRSQPIVRRNLENPHYFNLKQDGSITWTPQDGFSKTKATLNNNIF